MKGFDRVFLSNPFTFRRLEMATIHNNGWDFVKEGETYQYYI
jgi:hypothetical protein